MNPDKIVVTDEMVEAARAAFNKVRLREASPRRIVREWEAEAWRCAVKAAWNRRAPSVTREDIAAAIHAHCTLSRADIAQDMDGARDAADAILALFGGE